MNTTQDSTASGRNGVHSQASISDGECRLRNQMHWVQDQQLRKHASIHADLAKEVDRLARSSTGPAPMHILTGSPARKATEPLDRAATPIMEQLDTVAVPTRWRKQISTKRPVSHVGMDHLPPAARVLSPNPRASKSPFKSAEFRLTSDQSRKMASNSPGAIFREDDPSRLSQARTVIASPARPELVAAETSSSSLSSSRRPLSARASANTRAGHHFGMGSSRSHSSLGLSRPIDKMESVSRQQLDQLDMSNLHRLTMSQTPEQLRYMAILGAMNSRPPLDGMGKGTRRAHRKSDSNVSGVFLALKYSPAQLGFDGYGAPASLPEDIDELLNRHPQKTNASTQHEVYEMMRSSASSPALKRSLNQLPLYDGFINPTTAKVLRESMTPAAKAFGNTKAPVVSKEDLLLEKAQNVAHDTPSYKKQACGFNMRGETLVYSWAAPYDFREQHMNPRIVNPGKPPAPTTSSRAKFNKGFADNKQKMAAVAEAARLDALFEEPKGVRLCEHGGIGFYPTPAGAGRPTRAVKHKLDPSVGYHKYLSPELINLKRSHKTDTPEDPELVFTRVPLIIDDRAKIAREEEPLKGAWKSAPDLYPGSLVPTATRYRFVDRLRQNEWPKGTKNFLVKESVNRDLPGAQKPLGSEFPLRENVGNASGPYKPPTGICTVDDGGIGFHAENPGIV